MFTLILTEDLEVLFDPTDIDNIYLSVAFDIKGTWKSTFQNTEFKITQNWFHYDSLENCFKNLYLLKQGKLNCVELIDMGNESIVKFVKNKESYFVEINYSDNLSESDLLLKVEFSEEELGNCIRKIEEWEKWW